MLHHSKLEQKNNLERTLKIYIYYDIINVNYTNYLQ